MDRSPTPDIVLYERSGCHLCEDARGVLEALLATWSAAGDPVPRLVGRDIDSEPAWHAAFWDTIPVIEVGDRRLPLATSPERIRQFLESALSEAGARAARPPGPTPPGGPGA